MSDIDPVDAAVLRRIARGLDQATDAQLAARAATFAALSPSPVSDGLRQLADHAQEARRGAGASRGAREIPFAEIESAFTLAAHDTHPAVGVMPRAGYYIRISIGRGRYDYFYTDLDGVITTAPRGYARDYKPGRIIGLDAAVEQYAGGDAR